MTTAADAGPPPALTTTVTGDYNVQDEWRRYEERRDAYRRQRAVHPGLGPPPPSYANVGANGGHGFLEAFWHARHDCGTTVVPQVTRSGHTVRLAVTDPDGAPVDASAAIARDPSGCTIVTTYKTVVRYLEPGKFRLVGPDLDLTVWVQEKREPPGPTAPARP